MDVCFNANNDLESGIMAGSFKFWCNRLEPYVKRENGKFLNFEHECDPYDPSKPCDPSRLAKRNATNVMSPSLYAFEQRSQLVRAPMKYAYGSRLLNHRSCPNGPH